MRLTGVSNLYGYVNSPALKRIGTARNAARNSLRNSGSYGNFNANQILTNQKAKVLYNNTKTAAQNLRTHAERLTDGGKDGLFAKAQESGNTKDVVNEINDFIGQYNTMVKNMDSMGGTINGQYKKQLQNSFSSNEEALKAAGVTAGKDGTLSVSQETLKKADMETLKKAFGAGSGFVSQASSRSIYVEANAVTSQRSFSYSNYNNYGGYSNMNYGGGAGYFGGYGGTNGMIGSLLDSLF